MRPVWSRPSRVPTASTRSPASRTKSGPGDGCVAPPRVTATIDAPVSNNVNIGKGDGFDILNHAVIVHADPDDYKTQPTGNAGGRLACGVIKGNANAAAPAPAGAAAASSAQ